MSTGARWALVTVGVALAIIVAVFVFNGTLKSWTDEPPKTWVVQPGETLTLSADEVHPHNRYRCAGQEGVNLESAPDGSATVTCGGPPGY